MLGRRLRHALEYAKAEGPGALAKAAALEAVYSSYRVLPPATYMSIRMLLLLGYWPNLRHPRSFNEKIAHRELFAPHPMASLVADKWRVRQYVTERGLGDILNEVYFVSDDPGKIPFDDLPDRFVVKANHGSGWNVLVSDKRALDRQQLVAQCRRWLGLKYSNSVRSCSIHYDSIPPLIVVERYIQDRIRGLPLDYKFLCFHGEVRYIYVVDRCGPRHALTFYDPDWRKMDIGYVYPIGMSRPRPSRLEQMMEIAEHLSADFDFARIDLYSPDDDTIVFGEITLSPTGGTGDFHPRVWDFRLGALW